MQYILTEEEYNKLTNPFNGYIDTRELINNLRQVVFRETDFVCWNDMNIEEHNTYNIPINKKIFCNICPLGESNKMNKDLKLKQFLCPYDNVLNNEVNK